MILLDTHIWIWHLADRRSLSGEARETIDRIVHKNRPRSILVSAISVWELYMLIKKNRLVLTVPPASFITNTRRDPVMGIVPVDDTIARRSAELPDLHADPADRMILATAQELGLTIISRDARFPEYDVAPVVW